MSQIFRQGLNWLIVDHVSNLDFTTEVLETVSKKDWAPYTSAKGHKSRQHYIMNPNWMPMANFQEPTGWPKLRDKMKSLVQREMVNYGLMPMNWKELHACSAWTVIGEEGSYHTAHEHGPMNVSSVTYIKVPQQRRTLEELQALEPSTEKPNDQPYGQIFFVMDGGPYNTLSTPNYRILHITPQEGMIIIFPSWMIHGVYPQAAGTRQTLNIDFNGDPNYRFNLPHSGGASYG